MGPNPDFVGMVPTLVDGTARTSGRFEWLGSARARLGYLATPDILLYGTGGLAWTHYTHNEDLLTNRNAFALVPPRAGRRILLDVLRQLAFRLGRGYRRRDAAVQQQLARPPRISALRFRPFGHHLAVSMYFAGPWPRSGGNLTADVVRVGLSYKFDPDRFALGYTGADAIAALPYAKSPVAATPWTWAGFYLGAHGGYGWADDPFNKTLGFTGFLAGRFSRRCRKSIPAASSRVSTPAPTGNRVRWSAVSNSISPAPASRVRRSSAAGGLRVTQNDKFDPLGSVRARLGYLVTPDVLVYGTGGLAWTQFSAVNEFPGFAPSSLATQNWLFGWVGGGRRRSRGSATPTGSAASNICITTSAIPAASPATRAFGVCRRRPCSSGRLTADVVRAGLSYKLNWPDPAGAGRTDHRQGAVAAAVELERLLRRRSWRIWLGRRSVHADGGAVDLFIPQYRSSCSAA